MTSQWAQELTRLPDDRAGSVPTSPRRPDWAPSPGPDAGGAARLRALLDGRVGWHRPATERIGGQG